MGLVVICSEEIEQADHFQGLQSKFGRFQQADRASGLFGAGEMADEHADAAGVDIGNSFEVKDDFGMTLADKFDDGGVKAIERGPHTETSPKLDNFDAFQSFRINIQRRHLPEAGTANRFAALTPQYPFVTVRGQLR